MTEVSALRSRTNRFARVCLWCFSSGALLTVATGYLQNPLPDEGAAAHVFQISVAAFAVALLAFLVTAKWKDRRALRDVGLTALILAIAFGALYYLEHVFYATHLR